MSRTATSGPELNPEQWLAEHGDALFAYALARVNDRAAAEDLVQDALVSAWRARETFSGRSSERTWLIGILRHKILDHIRRQSRERPSGDAEALERVRQQYFDTARGGHWRSPPSRWDADPRRAVDVRQFRSRLAQCLRGLRSAHRHAFVLRELEGLEPAAICNALGVSATNLRVMLHRARLGLRECLSARWRTPGRERSHDNL